MPAQSVSDFLAARPVSAPREASVARLLADLEDALGSRSLAEASGDDVRAFLAAKRAGGYQPTTVRKWRAMVLAFYGWMWESGQVSADTLLAMRAIPAPASREGHPNPYKRQEITALWRLLDERWPKLSHEEYGRWVGRWREGRSPYSRVRSHGIHLQLEAIMRLALHLGLRRGEIAALDVDAMHPDNAGVIVWPKTGPWADGAREVPYTDAARSAVAEWLRFRRAARTDHQHPWLNLHAADTASQPMTRHTFDRLLLTYVGEGWTLKRLRDTGAVTWVRAGLPLKHLRLLLGLASMNDVLPYARLATMTLEQRVERVGPALDAELVRA